MVTFRRRACRLETGSWLGDEQYDLASGDPVDIDVWRDENANGRLFERTNRYSELYRGTLELH